MTDQWVESMLRKIAREAVEKRVELEKKIHELEDYVSSSAIRVGKRETPRNCFPVEAYVHCQTGGVLRTLIVVGQPTGEHSCDEMGCGQCHVVAKFDITDCSGWDVASNVF
jgi:hypothetical protein